MIRRMVYRRDPLVSRSMGWLSIRHYKRDLLPVDVEVTKSRYSRSANGRGVARMPFLMYTP